MLFQPKLPLLLQSQLPPRGLQLLSFWDLRLVFPLYLLRCLILAKANRGLSETYFSLCFFQNVPTPVVDKERDLGLPYSIPESVSVHSDPGGLFIGKNLRVNNCQLIKLPALCSQVINHRPISRRSPWSLSQKKLDQTHLGTSIRSFFLFSKSTFFFLTLERIAALATFRKQNKVRLILSKVGLSI